MIEAIQKEISLIPSLDGWLVYDFRGTNSIALKLLLEHEPCMLTRRFFYWIPKTGTPVKIVNDIEKETLNHLPGNTIYYGSWKSLEEAVGNVLQGKKKIAMEYVPNGKIPVISKLDAGTFEWLQSLGVDIINSWPIAQHFIARFTKEQQTLHAETAAMLMRAYQSAWNLLKTKTVSEYDLQQHIVELFEKEGYETDHPPIVAFGKNSALPHYSSSKDTIISSGNLLLIDLWAKKKQKEAPYADICQVAYIGNKAPVELSRLYDIVYEAQNKAFTFLKNKIAAGTEVQGCQVDDVAREVIAHHGYERQFLHRTGHNIHTDLHGLGPNLDNFETNDTRILLPRTCYSIEPGIYLTDHYGIRLECNVYIDDTRTVSQHGQSPKLLPTISI